MKRRIVDDGRYERLSDGAYKTTDAQGLRAGTYDVTIRETSLMTACTCTMTARDAPTTPSLKLPYNPIVRKHHPGERPLGRNGAQRIGVARLRGVCPPAARVPCARLKLR